MSIHLVSIEDNISIVSLMLKIDTLKLSEYVPIINVSVQVKSRLG